MSVRSSESTRSSSVFTPLVSADEPNKAVNFRAFFEIRGFNQVGVLLHISLNINTTNAIFVSPIFDVISECRRQPADTAPPIKYPNANIAAHIGSLDSLSLIVTIGEVPSLLADAF